MEFKTKADSQSVEDWMKQLEADCLELHMMAKDVVNIPNALKGDMVAWYMEYSDEPQYQMIALLGFYDKVDDERKNLIILKITSLIDECRTYVKKIKGQKREDKIIRTLAEWQYRKGRSVSEIIDTCIEVGILEKDDSVDDYRDNHQRRIQRYIQSFPSFQRKENEKPRVEKLIEFLNQGIKKTH